MLVWWLDRNGTFFQSTHFIFLCHCKLLKNQQRNFLAVSSSYFSNPSVLYLSWFWKWLYTQAEKFLELDSTFKIENQFFILVWISTRKLSQSGYTSICCNTERDQTLRHKNNSKWVCWKRKSNALVLSFLAIFVVLRSVQSLVAQIVFSLPPWVQLVDKWTVLLTSFSDEEGTVRNRV